MKTGPIDSYSHLEWAIRSRTQNQQSALKLLKLFSENEELWKTKEWSRAAQDLLSVVFSLWRSAFLANKKAVRAEVFDDAKEFLEALIEDNAITYVQDKKCKEWTFNYYIRNAMSSLERLHKHWPQCVPEFKNPRSPKPRWEYCQLLLDQAIEKFAALALEPKEILARREAKAKRRAEAKVRRQKSRQFTLENRAKPTSSEATP